MTHHPKHESSKVSTWTDRRGRTTTVAIPDDGWNFFISHAGQDLSHAQALRRALEDEGATVFEDSLLPAGSDWDTEIPLHLAAAKVCVVLVSVRTAEAHYERSEYQMAIDMYRQDRTRRIVPIYLDRLSGAERPFGLGILSSIQLDGSFGLDDAAKQLVRESAEGRSSPTPGPRETASLVVPLLVALDDSCRKIEDVDGPTTTFSPLIETAIAAAVAASDDADPDKAASSLRRALQRRGLDARVLLPSSSDHSEAVRRWLDHDPDDPDSLARGSLATLLVDFRRALGEALLSPTAHAVLRIPEIALPHLRHLLTEPFAPAPPGLESFLSALEALLPPLRSFSRSAVLVSDTANLTRSEEEHRHPSTRHVAVQMCRLPRADPFTTGIQALVEQQSGRLRNTIANSGNAVTWYSGIPGVGASTVAIEVARAIAEDFPGGVRYVDLRGLDPRIRRSPSNAVHLLAESLDVSMSGKSEEEEQFAALWSGLEGREILIVLDNARDASHVARFVPVPASCALIATSRDRLQSYASPGLACEVAPLSRHDSVALVSHAAGLSEDLAAVDAIARLCDDLPLALRLASAWMTSHPELTPDHFARLLEDGLTRLDYLAIGERAVRAAIDLSYQHLDDDCRRMLRFVAAAPGRTVTAGELSLALGEHTSQIELLLQRLADRSLADQLPMRTGTGEPFSRFSLPELIHLFALERLRAEESEETVEEFQRRYVKCLNDRLDEIVKDEMSADLTLELDWHGLREALRLATEGCWISEGLELANTLETFSVGQWDVGFMEEVTQRFMTLQLRAGAPADAVKTVLRLAQTLKRRKLSARAGKAFDQARALASEHSLEDLIATADFHLSLLAAEQEDWSTALQRGSNAAAIFERLGTPAAATPVAVNNSKVAERAGDRAASAQWAKTAWRLARRTSSEPLRAHAAAQFARLSIVLHEPPDITMEAFGEASDLFAHQEEYANAAIAATNAAFHAYLQDDPTTMIERSSTAVAHLRDRSEPGMLAAALVDLSAGYSQTGEYAEANVALREADEVACRSAWLLAELPHVTPAYLRYEIGVRVLALRMFTHDRPLLGDQPVLGEARRRLPVLKDDKRVDPDLEWVLELLGMVEAGNHPVNAADRLLVELLTRPAINRPPTGEFWLHDELHNELAAPIARLQP